MELGIKLWSINVNDYLPEARRLYGAGVFDYTELYVVPDTLNLLSLWKDLESPFILHAPHFMHGMNLALPECLEGNRRLFEQIKAYWTGLGASGLVLHGGTYGSIGETVRQVLLLCREFEINPKDIYLENKPLTVLKDGINHPSRGASPEEIAYAREQGLNFCLDIAHALCSANAQGIEPYLYITRFAALNAGMFHINDESIEAVQDEHRHIGAGGIDFTRIFSIIGKEVKAAVETVKDHPRLLDDFARDTARLRSFC